MAHGTRGRWMRAAVAGFGVLLCTGLVGCTDTSMAKPKSPLTNNQQKPPQTGLPGTPTLQQNGTVGTNQSSGLFPRTSSTTGTGTPTGFASNNTGRTSTGIGNNSGIVPTGGTTTSPFGVQTTGGVPAQTSQIPPNFGPGGTFGSGAGAVSPNDTIPQPIQPPAMPSLSAPANLGPQPPLGPQP